MASSASTAPYRPQSFPKQSCECIVVQPRGAPPFKSAQGGRPRHCTTEVHPLLLQPGREVRVDIGDGRVLPVGVGREQYLFGPAPFTALAQQPGVALEVADPLGRGLAGGRPPIAVVRVRGPTASPLESVVLECQPFLQCPRRDVVDSEGKVVVYDAVAPVVRRFDLRRIHAEQIRRAISVVDAFRVFLEFSIAAYPEAFQERYDGLPLGDGGIVRDQGRLLEEAASAPAASYERIRHECIRRFARAFFRQDRWHQVLTIAASA